MAYGLGDVVQQRLLIERSDGEEAFRRTALIKLEALLGLCETAECRRVRLLSYFGEESSPCGRCDTCLEPPETWDASEAARKALSCVYRTGQRFGATHLIDVLRGRETERVSRFRHDRLSVFGIGADLDEAEWRSVFRQLTALGLLQPDLEAWGALRLAPASRPVLRGETPIRMRRLKRGAAKKPRAAAVSAEMPPADQALLDSLKAWRLGEARQQNVPAYVIFHDRTLAAIAALRPTDLEALSAIDGIGARKLERYGEALLEIVRGHALRASTADAAGVNGS
jgi:ATP-dependent DNA helicase RecQ